MKKICGKWFSNSIIRMAEKLANDVSEDIDCREKREQLRDAIAYWSCVAAEEAQERAALESKYRLELAKRTCGI
jgi:hypothetical protein